MARAHYGQSGVPAGRSVLAPTACTPYTALYKGLILRNYMIAVVAMSAVLGDVLLVAVSGVPFSSGQILPSLQASAFTSLAILSIMAMTSIAVVVHNRTSAGGTRRLPRSPNTLIGVWLYLCGSSFAEHSIDDRDEQLPDLLDKHGLKARYDGGYYAFARAMGTDGVPRWTVDEASELRNGGFEVQQQQEQGHDQLQPPGSQDFINAFEASATPVVESNPYTQFRGQSRQHHQTLQTKPSQTNRHRYSPQQQYPNAPSRQRQSFAEAEVPNRSCYEVTSAQRFEQIRPRDYNHEHESRVYAIAQSQQQYSTREDTRMQDHNQYSDRPPPSKASQTSNNEAGWRYT